MVSIALRILSCVGVGSVPSAIPNDNWVSLTWLASWLSRGRWPGSILPEDILKKLNQPESKWWPTQKYPLAIHLIIRLIYRGGLRRLTRGTFFGWNTVSPRNSGKKIDGYTWDRTLIILSWRPGLNQLNYIVHNLQSFLSGGVRGDKASLKKRNYSSRSSWSLS